MHPYRLTQPYQFPEPHLPWLPPHRLYLLYPAAHSTGHLLYTNVVQQVIEGFYLPGQYQRSAVFEVHDKKVRKILDYGFP